LDLYTLKEILPKIAKRTILVKTFLTNTHPLYAFTLYKKCDQMKNEIFQQSAKKHISDFCKNMFHVRPYESIKLRIFESQLITRNTLKVLIKEIIRSLQVSSEYKQLLFLQSKIIFTGNKKLKHIVNNDIKWCKNWSIKNNPKCECESLATRLKLPLTDNHISCFGTQNLGEMEYTMLMTSNTNNICIPSLNNLRRNFRINLENYLQDTLSFLNKISKGKEKILFEAKRYSSNETENLKLLINNLLPFQSQIPLRDRIKNSLCREKHKTNQDNTPTAELAYKFKKEIDYNLIISSPDKNSGIMDIACPKPFWNQIKIQYWENKTHFEKLQDTQESFLKVFREKVSMTSPGTILQTSTKEGLLHMYM
jgi:hypothetical protein